MPMPMPSLAQMYGNAAAVGQQPPPGLSLQDLLPTAVPQVNYPDAPNLVTDPSQLSPEDQRHLRMETLMQTLAAGLAGGYGRGPGFGASALQAAFAARPELEDRAVAQARAQQISQYQTQRQAAEQDARGRQAQVLDAKQHQMASSLLGTYNSVMAAAQRSGMHPDDVATLEAQARSLAKAGDDAGLQKLLAGVPSTAAFAKTARQNGFDPSDPTAVADFKDQQKRAQQLDYETKLAQMKAQTEAQYRQPQPLQLHEMPDGSVAAFNPRTGRMIPVPGAPSPGYNVKDWHTAVGLGKDVLGGVDPSAAQAAFSLLQRGPGTAAVPPTGPAGPTGMAGAAGAGATIGQPGTPVAPSPVASPLPPEVMNNPAIRAQVQADLAAGKPVPQILQEMRAAGLIQ